MFERASEKGSPSGMLGLAGLYMHGYGVEVDYGQAYRYFTKATEQNQVRRMAGPAAPSVRRPACGAGLGALGRAVGCPGARCWGWCACAATGALQRHRRPGAAPTPAAASPPPAPLQVLLPEAYYHLGVMHLKGLGIKVKSAQKAFNYFNIAAHGGHLQVRAAGGRGCWAAGTARAAAALQRAASPDSSAPDQLLMLALPSRGLSLAPPPPPPATGPPTTTATTATTPAGHVQRCDDAAGRQGHRAAVPPCAGAAQGGG
jgi:hypothetical protein